MRRIFIILVALFLIVSFISTACAKEAVEAAKAKFKEVRETYIVAKEELSDAQIDALLTIGKVEKEKAVERVREARKVLKAAKKAYKDALSELHKAELARDAKIDRSPWR